MALVTVIMATPTKNVKSLLWFLLITTIVPLVWIHGVYFSLSSFHHQEVKEKSDHGDQQEPYKPQSIGSIAIITVVIVPFINNSHVR